MHKIGEKILVLFGLVCTAVCMTTTAVDWKGVDAKIAEKIAQGHFSGCVLGIYTNSSVLLRKPYGTIVPKWGLYAPQAALDQYFDINQITQVIGINSGLMQLYDQLRLNFTDRVSKHLFDFDNNGKRYLTLANVMLHNSGLQATMPEPFGTSPADLLKKIDNLKQEFKEETKFQYSQLGYVVLGQVIAKLNNKTLDSALFDIMVEAGMRETVYKPTVAPNLIVPSSYNKGTVRGMPANKIANFLGGVAGNAGMFSIIDNIGAYMQLLLNKGKMHLSSRVFSEEVVDAVTTKVVVKGYNNTRALGWDTVPAVDPPCGSKFSKNSFGFSDPLGSYVWADKDKNISIVMLVANGYPVQSAIPHAKAQGQISDAIMTALGY